MILALILAAQSMEILFLSMIRKQGSITISRFDNSNMPIQMTARAGAF